jgi:hypothetical protein
MRALNKKQKALLDGWIEKRHEDIGLSFKAEDLPNDLYFKIEALNNFEILNQAIEGYVIDHIFETK